MTFSPPITPFVGINTTTTIESSCNHLFNEANIVSLQSNTSDLCTIAYSEFHFVYELNVCICSQLIAYFMPHNSFGINGIIFKILPIKHAFL